MEGCASTTGGMGTGHNPLLATCRGCPSDHRIPVAPVRSACASQFRPRVSPTNTQATAPKKRKRLHGQRAHWRTDTAPVRLAAVCPTEAARGARRRRERAHRQEGAPFHTKAAHRIQGVFHRLDESQRHSLDRLARTRDRRRKVFRLDQHNSRTIRGFPHQLRQALPVPRPAASARRNGYGTPVENTHGVGMLTTPALVRTSGSSGNVFARHVACVLTVPRPPVNPMSTNAHPLHTPQDRRHSTHRISSMDFSLFHCVAASQRISVYGLAR